MMYFKRSARKDNKKGQMQSQLFTYIITVVVIGMLLFFSIKWLGGLMDTGKRMDITRFKSDLEKSFETIAPNYGSYAFEKFVLPEGINKVCFVDLEKPLSERQTSGICDSSAGSEWFSIPICDSWTELDASENVLFDPVIGEPVVLPDLKIGNPEGYLCFNVEDGYIEVKLISRGAKVEVKDPNV